MRLSKTDLVFDSVIIILLAIALLVVLLPIVHIFAASFSSPAAVTSGSVLFWPKHPSMEGYKAVFSNSKILIGYRNTLVYTIVGTFINVMFTILAAYPLSRKDMPGRSFFSFLFTFTMIFNGGLIPTYLLNMNLGLLNTLWVMVLPNAIGVWNLMLCKNYFEQSISPQLLEAAQMDGCQDFRYLVSIVVPLSKPIIAVLVLFYAVEHWNAFFNAFIYLSDDKMMPLQIVLRDILIANEIDPSAIIDAESMAAKEGLSDLLKYATIVVACLPIWCLYPFVQKYFVKGVMIGAIKG